MFLLNNYEAEAIENLKSIRKNIDYLISTFKDYCIDYDDFEKIEELKTVFEQVTNNYED